MLGDLTNAHALLAVLYLTENGLLLLVKNICVEADAQEFKLGLQTLSLVEMGSEAKRGQ